MIAAKTRSQSMKRRDLETRQTVADLKRRARRWLREWGSASDFNVTTNGRLRRSRGRVIAAVRTIELRPDVLTAGPAELLETLCHEAAHVAVLDLAPGARPHGREWRQLMIDAGFDPRHSQTVRGCITVENPRVGSTTSVWVHICPVCQMSRMAKRPVTAWRCAACIAAGLGGRLEISKQPSGRTLR